MCIAEAQTIPPGSAAADRRPRLLHSRERPEFFGLRSPEPIGKTRFAKIYIFFHFLSFSFIFVALRFIFVARLFIFFVRSRIFPHIQFNHKELT
jgi:hypothetical protein